MINPLKKKGLSRVWIPRGGDHRGHFRDCLPSMHSMSVVSAVVGEERWSMGAMSELPTPDPYLSFSFSFELTPFSLYPSIRFYTHWTLGFNHLPDYLTFCLNSSSLHLTLMYMQVTEHFPVRNWVLGRDLTKRQKIVVREIETSR